MVQRILARLYFFKAGGILAYIGNVEFKLMTDGSGAKVSTISLHENPSHVLQILHGGTKNNVNFTSAGTIPRPSEQYLDKLKGLRTC